MTEKSSVILLDEVRACRARATSIRKLAARAADGEIAEALRVYAAAIERRASDLEERVAALGTAAALTALLSRSISGTIVETRREISRLRRRVAPR